MNAVDIILIIVIAVAVGLAVRRIIRGRKSSCCGEPGCQACERRCGRS